MVAMRTMSLNCPVEHEAGTTPFEFWMAQARRTGTSSSRALSMRFCARIQSAPRCLSASLKPGACLRFAGTCRREPPHSDEEHRYRCVRCHPWPTRWFRLVPFVPFDREFSLRPCAVCASRSLCISRESTANVCGYRDVLRNSPETSAAARTRRTNVRNQRLSFRLLRLLRLLCFLFFDRDDGVPVRENRPPGGSLPEPRREDGTRVRSCVWRHERRVGGCICLCGHRRTLSAAQACVVRCVHGQERHILGWPRLNLSRRWQHCQHVGLARARCYSSHAWFSGACWYLCVNVRVHHIGTDDVTT